MYELQALSENKEAHAALTLDRALWEPLLGLSG